MDNQPFSHPYHRPATPPPAQPTQTFAPAVPPPQAPITPALPVQQLNDVNPTAVVQVYSTRGVEYAMLTLCLFLAAGAIIGTLLACINGAGHFKVLALPVSLLVVCLPVFSYLFLRQKKAELATPALKLDPSKRRLTQFTQIIAFAACLFNLIAFVYLVFSKLAGQSEPSLGKDVLNLLVVLVVAGSILAYYWNDEHRQGR